MDCAPAPHLILQPFEARRAFGLVTGVVNAVLQYAAVAALVFVASIPNVLLGQVQQAHSAGTGDKKTSFSYTEVDRNPSTSRRKIQRPLRPGMATATPASHVERANFQDDSHLYEEYSEEENPIGGRYALPASECCPSSSPSQCCQSNFTGGIPWRLTPGRAGKWLTGEYLHWGISTADLPPLITTSAVGTPAATTGVLGQPTTRVLFGDGSETDARSGYRISGGWWLDCSNAAMEIVYSGLPSYEQRAAFNSGQFPLLARPVFNTGTSSEAAMIISHPSQMLGNVSILTNTEFQQVDFLRRVRQYQDNWHRLDTVIGLRLALLEENLRIDQSSTYSTGVGQIISGTRIDLFDQFSTKNQFVGFVVGGEYNRHFGRWTCDIKTMLSLGNNRAEVNISGQTITNVPNAGSATFEGGLLAQQTNIGQSTRDQFVLIPEFYIGGRTQIDRCWEASVGYTFMYWNDAVQPGNQIDTRVSQFPPEPPVGPNPRAQFNTKSIVFHGVHAGLTFKF